MGDHILPSGRRQFSPPLRTFVVAPITRVPTWRSSTSKCRARAASRCWPHCRRRSGRWRSCSRPNDSFALQAFGLATLDYLLKPVDDERFDEALDRAQQAFRYRGQGRSPASAAAPLRSFSVRVGSRTVLVPVADVERIEADGDYATLHANGKSWLVRERLHNLAMRLDPRQFQRVHRSSIVRLDMIAELCSLTNRDALLRLRDGRVLRASRSYMPALGEALQHLGRKPE